MKGTLTSKPEVFWLNRMMTNAHLEGAALNSQHTWVMALDIHIPGVDHNQVARDVASFVDGGVGMYPGRGFVHYDFGPLRRWVG